MFLLSLFQQMFLLVQQNTLYRVREGNFHDSNLQIFECNLWNWQYSVNFRNQIRTVPLITSGRVPRRKSNCHTLPYFNKPCRFSLSLQSLDLYVTQLPQMREKYGPIAKRSADILQKQRGGGAWGLGTNVRAAPPRTQRDGGWGLPNL